MNGGEVLAFDLTPILDFLAAAARFFVGTVLALHAGRLFYKEGITAAQPWLYLGAALALFWTVSGADTKGGER